MIACFHYYASLIFHCLQSPLPETWNLLGHRTLDTGLKDLPYVNNVSVANLTASDDGALVDTPGAMTS